MPEDLGFPGGLQARHIPGVNGTSRNWQRMGYSNREIAQELKLTEQIVKNVLHSVFDRLGVWNRVELANRFGKGVEFSNVTDIPRQTGSKRSEQVPGEILETERSVERLSVADTGMELRDLRADPEFPLRQKRPRQELCAADAYRTLGRVFADAPDIVLQRLVDAATTFCGADSAGISLEQADEDGERRFHWIAVSGSFAPFLGGTTPRFFSPCGITLSSGRAQLYRLGCAYYDYLGIKAEPSQTAYSSHGRPAKCGGRSGLSPIVIAKLSMSTTSSCSTDWRSFLRWQWKTVFMEGCRGEKKWRRVPPRDVLPLRPQRPHD